MMPARAGAQDRRVVAAGRRAVVFFWIAVEPAALPRSLRHRVTIGELNVSGAPVVVSTAEADRDRAAAQGRRLARGQRTGPRLRPPAGVDSPWRAARASRSASRSTGSRSAPTGGRSAATRRTIAAISRTAWTRWPSPMPSSRRSRTAFRRTCRDRRHARCRSRSRRSAAIYVVLDLGGGRFAFYAHLQPGSLRVKAGDRVKAGQVLGLVGNSGNSTEPHLHFHISNGISPLGSEGLPYAITGKTGMPLQNSRVDFGK